MSQESAQSTALRILLLGVALLLFSLLVWHGVRHVRLESIRGRLFVCFTLVVLIPAIAFAGAALVVGYRSGLQQVINQLESVSTIKEGQIDDWVLHVQADLAMSMVGDEAQGYALQILSAPFDPDREDVAYAALHKQFAQIVEESASLDEIFLMDLDRRVVLSTNLRREGQSAGPNSHVYFRKGLEGEYLHPPSYHLTVGGTAVIAVRPIRDDEERAVGVLGGRANLDALSAIMLERTGLGRTGETYVVGESRVVLTETLVQPGGWSRTWWAFSVGANEALGKHTDGSGVYRNYRGDSVVGVYHWLPQLEVALLAEQSLSEAMSSTYATLGIYVGVTIAAVLLAVVTAMLLARALSRPLADLADAAVNIAGGDLAGKAPLGSIREVAALAQAFNSMTRQLRETIEGLEDAVARRTADVLTANRNLRRRAVQLETSAQVSRQATSILEIDELLNSAVTLIRDAFDYYHVHVFLLDDTTEHLLLRSSTAPVQLQWQELDLRSQSINAHAAKDSQGILVNDVARDARFLFDPALPEIRSEAVVPLRIGNRVMGTLDVQSSELDTFSEDDLKVLQSLGDQIAVAIENARLYDGIRTLAVLEERGRLARELHDSVTQSLYSARLVAETVRRTLRDVGPEQADDQLVRLSQIVQDALKQMRLLLYEMRPPMVDAIGLGHALQQRLDAVETRAGVHATLVVDNKIDLPRETEEVLYSVAHEALNNALKHAEADQVTVTIRADDARVVLEVTDDGRGFDPASVRGRSGLGLLGMRERMETLGGVLDIRSARGEGTCVRAELALSQEKSPSAS